MHAFTRLVCLLCVAPSLTACAPMLSLIGTNQTLVQIVAQVERVKLAGDGASYVASSKTITDHALSMVTGSDCKIFNAVTREPVCAAKSGTAAADANVKVSLVPAGEPLPQPSAQAAAETDTANAAPPHDQATGDE